MTFDAHIFHWPTLSAFDAYLQTVPRPAWCHGLTNHNTFIPNEDQWRGQRSVESCMQTYINKGWPSGPHLFLAAAAPNPADTGIFQLTPIAHPGTHAGACNADHLGIENVGDFNRAPPSADQYTLLLTVNRLLLAHWMLTPSMVNVHNECMAGRTCPGKYLTGAQIRADLSTAWPPAPVDPFKLWGDIGKPVGEAQGYAIPQAWLKNQKLGACIVPETYSKSGKYSLAEFRNGIITYMKARNVALVEMF